MLKLLSPTKEKQKPNLSSNINHFDGGAGGAELSPSTTGVGAILLFFSLPPSSEDSETLRSRFTPATTLAVSEALLSRLTPAIMPGTLLVEPLT